MDWGCWPTWSYLWLWLTFFPSERSEGQSFLLTWPMENGDFHHLSQVTGPELSFKSKYPSLRAIWFGAWEGLNQFVKRDSGGWGPLQGPESLLMSPGLSSGSQQLYRKETPACATWACFPELWTTFLSFPAITNGVICAVGMASRCISTLPLSLHQEKGSQSSNWKQNETQEQLLKAKPTP